MRNRGKQWRQISRRSVRQLLLNVVSTYNLQSMFQSLSKNLSQNVPLHVIREGRSERREKGWNRDYGSREEGEKRREGRGGEPRWPFRNQVLPTSVPARKNNLSSQTSPLPSLLLRMTGRTTRMGTFECSAISEKKIFEEQNMAQIEIFNRPTIQQAGPNIRSHDCQVLI